MPVTSELEFQGSEPPCQKKKGFLTTQNRSSLFAWNPYPQFRQRPSVIRMVRTGVKLLCGKNIFKWVFSLLPDLNTYSLILSFWLDLVLDHPSHNLSTVSGLAYLIQAFLSNYGVFDVWRFQVTEVIHFFHVKDTYLRIDYLFIDNQLVSLVHSCFCNSIVISNHPSMVLSMSLPDPLQRNRQLYFSSTLLSDDNFVTFMANEIESNTDYGAILDFLGRLNISRLSAEFIKKLEEPISQAEIALALTSLQSGKCLGPNDFPTEFFKKFSLLLSPLLCLGLWFL